MKISVIVPIYNVKKYLRRCIDSILSQTFADFECILVDDGSTDGCDDICDEYKQADNRIKVIHKENGGVSSARNEGMKAALGEYIFFIDADDFVENSLFATVVSELEQYDWDVIVFNFKYINEEGYVSRESQCPEGICEIDSVQSYLYFVCNEMQGKTGWSPWNKFFKRSLIIESGIEFYPREEIFAEDLYFYLILLLYVRKIKVIDNALYNYREWDGSCTKSNRETRINEFVKLNIELFNYYKVHGYNYLIKNYSCIFYRIMNNRYVQASKEQIMDALPNIENKKMFRWFTIKSLFYTKKAVKMLKYVNGNSMIYEQLTYLVYSGNNAFYKLIQLVYRMVSNILIQ